MRYITQPSTILFAAILLLLSGCDETWPREEKEALYSTCMEQAVPKARDSATAKSYCDCYQRKVIRKYPHVVDALQHLNDIPNDTGVQKCRELLK